MNIREFASTFVRRLREHPRIHECFKPSMSQSVAISSLLAARRIRKRHLTRADFIEAAVTTSTPFIRDYINVESVALEVLQALQSLKPRPMPASVESASGKVSDEKVLELWFKRRDELTGKQREALREQAKRFLHKVGLRYASIFLYDFYEAKAGSTKGHVIRKYRMGIDDPSLIDFESTIEDAINRGKEMEHLTYEDFITSQVKRKRRIVSYLLDASASFNYQTLLNCAVCGSMLIHGLNKRDDQVAIAYFSDDVHAIKEFFDKKDEEAVIEEFISLEPLSGTNVEKALTWAREQFERVGRDFAKFCLVSSDMGFNRASVEQALEEVEKLQDMGVKIVLLGFEPFRSYFQEERGMLERSGCEMVDVNRAWDFPKIIGRIISPR